MISPHPTTTQLVAEAARRVRFAALVASRHHPGLFRIGYRCLVGLTIKTGIFGGREVARSRQPTNVQPTAVEVAGTDTVGSWPANRSPNRRRVVPEFRRYRSAVNKATCDVTDRSRAFGNINTD